MLLQPSMQADKLPAHNGLSAGAFVISTSNLPTASAEAFHLVAAVHAAASELHVVLLGVLASKNKMHRIGKGHCMQA